MDYVAIDFEKLNGSQSSVCEVGLVVFKDGKEVAPPFHSYIKPVGGLERNNWAKEHLKHISDEDLLKAPTYKDLFPKMQQIIKDKILVVHSKGADLNYIYNLEEQYKLPKLYSRWADTYEIAKSLGRVESLSDLYSEYFGTPFIDHHKAEEDARACGLIFNCFRSETDINDFVHSEEYLPSDVKGKYDGTKNGHTRNKPSVVSTDGLKIKNEEITNISFFEGKKVVTSGMSVVDKKKIIYVLEEQFGAKCTENISGRTNVLITDRNKVGSSKKDKALEYQETGLTIITDDYFWQLVKGV